MKRSDWTVGDEGIRPAGKPGHCFYCGMARGEQHKADCVIRNRTIVLRFTVALVVDIPENWTEENIHFRYNEGTWCANNLVDMLSERVEASDKEDSDIGCLCDCVEVQYHREATEDDEARSTVRVANLPS